MNPTKTVIENQIESQKAWDAIEKMICEKCQKRRKLLHKFTKKTYKMNRVTEYQTIEVEFE